MGETKREKGRGTRELGNWNREGEGNGNKGSGTERRGKWEQEPRGKGNGRGMETVQLGNVI